MKKNQQETMVENNDLPNNETTLEEVVIETPETTETTDEVIDILASTINTVINEKVQSAVVPAFVPTGNIKTVVEKKRGKITDVPDVVYIRRRVRQETTFRYGEGIVAADIQADELKYIGSSFGKGKATLRGLEPEEEEVYLPKIIGISKTSPDWDRATNDYWINIRKPVPSGDTGLELQIGFRYPDKETALVAEEKYRTTKNIRSRSRYGEPINVEDYILYRYCLKYGKVANTFDDLNKSEKIEFYIHSKAKAVADQHKALKQKQDAYAKYLQIAGDVERKTAVLIRFGENTSHLTEEEVDVKLNQLLEKDPRAFKAFVDDPDLVIKALIDLAIVHQKLIKTPNTEIIHFGSKLLGNTIEEVVRKLKTPECSGDLLSLKMQVKYLTTQRLLTEEEEEEIIGEDF